MLLTASADAPRTVTPEIGDAGPALAVARTIGSTASTPGNCTIARRGAARSTGTRARRFSRTTTSVGSANAARSHSPCARVERYDSAERRKPEREGEERGRDTRRARCARRETPRPHARVTRRAKSRPTTGRSRAAPIAAANPTSPGQEEQDDRRRPALGELVRVHRAAREDSERGDEGERRRRARAARSVPHAAARARRSGRRRARHPARGSPSRCRAERARSPRGPRRGAPAATAAAPPARLRRPSRALRPEANGSALGSRQQASLTGGRAVPREPAPGGGEVAPVARRPRARRTRTGARPPRRRRAAAVARRRSRRARPRAAPRPASQRPGGRARLERRPAPGRRLPRARRSPTAVVCRRPAVAPSRSCGRSARARARRRAPRLLPRRRAALAGGGGSPPRRRAPARARRRPARCRSARESRRRAAASAASPFRPRRRAGPSRPGGVHVLGAAAPRSDPSGRCGATGPSAGGRAARARRPPRGRRRRPRSCSPGRARSSSASEPAAAPSSAAAATSSCDQASSRPAGTPNHEARTARESAGRRSTSCATLRSCATVPPTRTPASTRRPPRSRAPRRALRCPCARGGRGRARRRTGSRSPRTCLVPAAVRARLLPATADLHRAPARRAVARAVVEEPAARLLAARLQPLPDAVRPRRCDDGDDRREAPAGRRFRRPDRRAVGSDPECERKALSARSTSPVAPVRAPAQGCSRARAREARRGGPSRQRSPPGRRRRRSSSSRRSRSHVSSAAGLPTSSRFQSGISVLTKSWTRSSGAGARRAPAGLERVDHAATVPAAAPPVNGLGGYAVTGVKP